MRVTLFDYGAGNIHSLSKALATVADAEVRVQTDPVKALDTDVLVLPGVGAFGAAAARLEPGREQMRQALEAGLPCLGICLGMQTMVIEYARNVCGLERANSTEFDNATPHRVIYKLRELKGVDELGGTMRLDAYKCRLAAGSFAARAYGTDEVSEPAGR